MLQTACEKCDQPASPGSRFCEAHQALPLKPKARTPLFRIEIIIGVVSVAGLWIYYAQLGGPASAPSANTPAAAPTVVATTSKEPAAFAERDAQARKATAVPTAGAPAAAVGAARRPSLEGAVCGNGVVEAGEACDGGNLGKATCATLGFSGDCKDNCPHVGLSCLANCTLDFSGCTLESENFAQPFVDNGDGTGFDRVTGLMWELKCGAAACPDRHDVTATWDWKGAVTDWIEAVNEEEYAGYRDWRLPTVEELRTLLAAIPACNSGSCGEANSQYATAPAGYWSSTSFSLDTQRAWAVSFRDGDAYTAEKDDVLHVRAVRRAP